jgi:hypothetical protein
MSTRKVTFILIGWTLFGIICVFAFHYILSNNTNNIAWSGWSILEALANWILVCGIIIAIWQISESRRTTNAQLAVDILEKFKEKEIIDILEEIYNLDEIDKQYLKDQPIENISLRRLYSEKRHRINQVLYRIDLLAALVKRGIIEDKLAIEIYFGASVLRCWYQLGDVYIKELRKQRGIFCIAIDDFVKRSLRFQIENMSPEQWTRLSRIGKDPVCLVDELIQKGNLFSESEKIYFLKKYKSKFDKLNS